MERELETCKVAFMGNVDDGKSTLVGNLLSELNVLKLDRVQLVHEASSVRGESQALMAFVTDGLLKERALRVTMDVSHQYFRRMGRKYIFADCPGHEKYMTNAISGLSGADIAVVLVDVSKGLRPQTLRHAQLASLLGVQSIIFCLNKMDMVAFSWAAVESLIIEILELVNQLGLTGVSIVPASGLCKENLVQSSSKISEYSGASLMGLIEDADIEIRGVAGEYGAGESIGAHNGAEAEAPTASRYMVQRQSSAPLSTGCLLDGYVLSGRFKVGDPIKIFPGGQEVDIAGLATMDDPSLKEISVSMSSQLEIKSTGDLISVVMVAKADDAPQESKSFQGIVIPFSSQIFSSGRRLKLRTSIQEQPLQLFSQLGPLSPGLHWEGVDPCCHAQIKLDEPIVWDSFSKCPETGRGLLIDESTDETVGAFLFEQ